MPAAAERGSTSRLVAAPVMPLGRRRAFSKIPMRMNRPQDRRAQTAAPHPAEGSVERHRSKGGRRLGARAGPPAARSPWPRGTLRAPSQVPTQKARSSSTEPEVSWMTEPCIKGSVFLGCIDDLRRHVEAGRVAREELELHLRPEDIAFLDQKINASQWYPIASYARIIEQLGQLEGSGQPDYFRKRGAASAQRLVDAGFYPQLAFVNEAQKNGPPTAEERREIRRQFRFKLRLAISLSSAIYNVGRWKLSESPDDPNTLRIEIGDAAAYTQPMREAIEGFYNRCAELARGRPGEFWRIARNDADGLVLEMTRPLAA